MNIEIKKTYLLLFVAFLLSITSVCAQQDTVFVWKDGNVIYKRAMSQIDSIFFIPPATPPPPCTGTVSDLSGFIYNVVKIGTQCWMKENLKTRRYNDNTVIDNLTDNVQWSLNTTGAMCYNNNDQGTANPNGAYYNWYAVATGKLCPAGWHVPTNEEWDVLVNHLIANGYNWDGATSGNKVAKSLAAVSPGNRGPWAEVIIDGAPGCTTDFGEIIRNATGFTVYPSGSREANGVFGDLNHFTYLWSSNTKMPWLRYMYFSNPELGGYNTQKGNGLSVRCLRDN